jgi:putative glutamine amidotransferase
LQESFIIYLSGAKMSHPVIGITTGHSENKYGLPQIHLLDTYVNATLMAGGIPLILPPELHKEEKWRTVYNLTDGILLSGGADIDPKRFGGEEHPSVHGVDSERDALEIAIVRQAVADGKPFLGICRGFQLLNVAFGGTLYTHIRDQFSAEINHDTSPQKPRSTLAHLVDVETDSHLGKILQEKTLTVNSWHHQGAKEIPPQLKITAHAPDGLVEAMELSEHPFGIAVQWHPEWMLDNPHMQALFRAFIDASQA